jgi:hypothetical protein
LGNLPPTADSGGPYRGTADLSVSFDGTASGDPDGTVSGYVWDFGDGIFDTGPSPAHTYAAEGNYFVTLTVTDDVGWFDASLTVALIGPAGAPPPEPPPPPVDGNDGGSCFVATAAYGSYLEPEVRLLRDFRDQRLMTNVPGRAFVSWYYRTSPPFADVIAGSEVLRFVSRLALTPLVYGIKYPMVPGLMFFLMIIPLVRRMGRKLM